MVKIGKLCIKIRTNKVLSAASQKPFHIDVPITASILRTFGQSLAHNELMSRHSKAQAVDADAQAIWGNRNAKACPAAYSEPYRPIPEAI